MAVGGEFNIFVGEMQCVFFSNKPAFSSLLLSSFAETPAHVTVFPPPEPSPALFVPEIIHTLFLNRNKTYSCFKTEITHTPF